VEAIVRIVPSQKKDGGLAEVCGVINVICRYTAAMLNMMAALSLISSWARQLTAGGGVTFAILVLYSAQRTQPIFRTRVADDLAGKLL